MVALGGTNRSINTFSHSCINHGNQSQQSAIDVTQSLQTSLNMPHAAVAQHISASQINLPIGNISVQFIPQPPNPTSLKHEQSSRFSNSNCMVPSQHYRLLSSQSRQECYHPPGASAAAYMPSSAAGPQSSAQPGLRVQTTPQPSAPPAPQQDMSKTPMAGHNYASSSNQTPSQTRQQFSNFQYRAAQHGSTRPRQPQSFIPGTPATTNPQVMYPTYMLGPTHMGIQPSYQQPRSNTPGGYYQYMAPYISYNTPPSHTSPYYYTSNSQIPTQNIQSNAPGGRSNPSTLGPQGAPAAPAAPTASLPQPQAQNHMHQTMSGVRVAQQKRPSHRIPIINPDTQQDILSDLYANEKYVSTDSSERQTPQPESVSSVAEFTRRVKEVANQPTICETLKSNYVSKNTTELPISSTTACSVQPQSNAIISNNNNNNVVKSEILTDNESKVTKVIVNLGPDVAVELNETPVVSAISDSPVIVPKMPMNTKQFQMNSDQDIQILAIDKNVVSNKQYKQNKHKPVVPEVNEVETPLDASTVPALSVPLTNVPSIVAAVPGPFAPPPAFLASTPASTPAPQPQRIREPRDRMRSEEKEKYKDVHEEKELSTPISSRPNGPSLPVGTYNVGNSKLNHLHQRTPSEKVFNPVDSLTKTIKPSTSQSGQTTSAESTNKELSMKQLSPAAETDTPSTETPSIKTLSIETPSVETPSIETTSIESTSIRTPSIETPSIETSSTETPTIISSVTVPTVDTRIEQATIESTLPAPSAPTATQLLSASIEKLAKELPTTVPEDTPDTKEESSAIQAQAKLTQSLVAGCLRINQTEFKMKDINLNSKTTDPDTANGNTTELGETEVVKEDINKNENVVISSKNINITPANKMANTETSAQEAESFENGKDETDKIGNVEQDDMSITENFEKPLLDSVSEKKMDELLTNPDTKPELLATPSVYIPKYNYNPGQWSPLNTSGKKCYDISLLKQMKDDPLSKNKPNAPLLDVCNVVRMVPMQESLQFATISRPMNDTFLPPFAKNSGMASRTNPPRDPKKDGRNVTTSGKGSVKMPAVTSSSSTHKQMIMVSLSRGEEIKLNETKDPWKPLRYKKDGTNEDEFKTMELYKQFRGILNKLTPQKFDTLLDKVKTLEINNQKRLEGVIDLVFEKAIEEPNFSEAYAAMCNKLSMLKVPADNATSPDQCVNFRGLIISRCQNQFVTEKVDANVTKLEKELAECTDPTKKKELQAQLVEENRRLRMRSVGNVRFIGELYKLKMLTSKIMVYCMNFLIDKLEEEKLECLCKLLTTIGEQVESEVKEPLDNVFKKMQDIVERKSNKISSRVRFMIQDVIELRRRRWVIKSVVDSQPKMMDQIQKEAEQQQRHIELMNSNPMGGFRRDEGGRGKRSGDARRQNSNSFMDSGNNWKTTSRPNYTVDTSKLKAVTQKNLSNIKLAPQNSGWNHGSGTKNTAQAGSNSMISLTKTNMYSVLENVQTDPTSLRGNKDLSPSFHSKGASIERSTFNSRGDFNSGSGGRSGSMGVARSASGSRSTSAALPVPAAVLAPAAPAAPVPQEHLPEAKKKSVKSMIELCLINPDDEEMVSEVKQLFAPQYHADVVTEILNVALEKPAKVVVIIAKSLLHLVSTNTISAENFVAGVKEILEFAPDLHIDIPMLYDYLGKFIAPQIEKKHITFVKIFRLSENIISSHQGHLFLKAIVGELRDSMGPSFVKIKWQESGLQLKEWMSDDQVQKWIDDNKFEFLEGGANAIGETKKILTLTETQSKLLQLMNSDENCDCIRGWVQDNLGKSSNEDWFMRSLIQAICEHALFGAEGRDVPHFNQDRMNKYSRLINEFGETQQSREASCLFGIQQLIHRLEHPQGLTLEIFQYLHEQYIISPEGFIAWEESEMEPEGKGVMMKALTSFFTNIKEADNEDSGSEG